MSVWKNRASLTGQQVERQEGQATLAKTFAQGARLRQGIIYDILPKTNLVQVKLKNSNEILGGTENYMPLSNKDKAVAQEYGTLEKGMAVTVITAGERDALGIVFITGHGSDTRSTVASNETKLSPLALIATI